MPHQPHLKHLNHQGGANMGMGAMGDHSMQAMMRPVGGQGAVFQERHFGGAAVERSAGHRAEMLQHLSRISHLDVPQESRQRLPFRRSSLHPAPSPAPRQELPSESSPHGQKPHLNDSRAAASVNAARENSERGESAEEAAASALLLAAGGLPRRDRSQSPSHNARVSESSQRKDAVDSKDGHSALPSLASSTEKENDSAAENINSSEPSSKAPSPNVGTDECEDPRDSGVDVESPPSKDQQNLQSRSFDSKLASTSQDQEDLDSQQSFLRTSTRSTDDADQPSTSTKANGVTPPRDQHSNRQDDTSHDESGRPCHVSPVSSNSVETEGDVEPPSASSYSARASISSRSTPNEQSYYPERGQDHAPVSLSAASEPNAAPPSHLNEAIIQHCNQSRFKPNDHVPNESYPHQHHPHALVVSHHDHPHMSHEQHLPHGAKLAEGASISLSSGRTNSVPRLYRQNEQNQSSGLPPSVVMMPHFPSLLHEVLSASQQAGSVLEWLPHGQGWRVLRWDEMNRVVIPTYFPELCSPDDEGERGDLVKAFLWHVRAWGFREVREGIDMGSYRHSLFLRGAPNLCQQMRLTNASSVSPSHRGCGAYGHLGSAPTMPPAFATSASSIFKTRSLSDHRSLRQSASGDRSAPLSGERNDKSNQLKPPRALRSVSSSGYGSPAVRPPNVPYASLQVPALNSSELPKRDDSMRVPETHQPRTPATSRSCVVTTSPPSVKRKLGPHPNKEQEDEPHYTSSHPDMSGERAWTTGRPAASSIASVSSDGPSPPRSTQPSTQHNSLSQAPSPGMPPHLINQRLESQFGRRRFVPESPETPLHDDRGDGKGQQLSKNKEEEQSRRPSGLEQAASNPPNNGQAARKTIQQDHSLRKDRSGSSPLPQESSAGQSAQVSGTSPSSLGRREVSTSMTVATVRGSGKTATTGSPALGPRLVRSGRGGSKFSVVQPTTHRDLEDRSLGRRGVVGSGSASSSPSPSSCRQSGTPTNSAYSSMSKTSPQSGSTTPSFPVSNRGKGIRGRASQPSSGNLPASVMMCPPRRDMGHYAVGERLATVGERLATGSGVNATSGSKRMYSGASLPPIPKLPGQKPLSHHQLSSMPRIPNRPIITEGGNRSNTFAMAVAVSRKSKRPRQGI